MKRTDLKAGEIYAVRRAGQPCMLLSADVYEQRLNRMGPDEYRRTPNQKPRRGSMMSSPSYGFVFLTGDADALAKADGPAILAHVEAHGYTNAAVPDGVWLNFATNAAEILAPYAEHQAAEEQRRAANRERFHQKERERAEFVVRHNAVVARLNAALGSDVIPLADGWTPEAPVHVTIALAQAEEIAGLLEGRP